MDFVATGICSGFEEAKNQSISAEFVDPVLSILVEPWENSTIEAERMKWQWMSGFL